MTRIGGFIIVALATLPVHPAAAEAPLADEIAKTHMATRAALVPTLPKQLDATTTLTGVETDDIKLTYQFRIEQDKEGRGPELKEALGRRAITMACGNPVNRKILDAGGRFGFEFADKFDEQILNVTVTRATCR